MIAGENFGCGSSREHAPWALLDFGIGCVIAPSFADIFYNNCFKNGILPVTLPEAAVASLLEQAEAGDNARVTVDLENGAVTAPDGERFAFEIDPFRRRCLLEGLDDIGLTLRKEAAIGASSRRRGASSGTGSAARRRSEAMASNRKLLLLPGDGIGPEVMNETRKAIDWFGKRGAVGFETEQALAGGSSYDEYGTPLTDATMDLALAADAVLFGAVGGPKWDELDFSVKPERGLLRLRKDMDLFANLRPAAVFDPLVEASTLKPEVVRGLDIMIVRELTGGIYFGAPRGVEALPGGGRRGVNTEVYTTPEIERVRPRRLRPRAQAARARAFGRKGQRHGKRPDVARGHAGAARPRLRRCRTTPHVCRQRGDAARA